jgi:hypothetical protein
MRSWCARRARPQVARPSSHTARSLGCVIGLVTSVCRGRTNPSGPRMSPSSRTVGLPVAPPSRGETSVACRCACRPCPPRLRRDPSDRSLLHGYEIPRRGFPGPLCSVFAVFHDLDGLPLPGLPGMFQPLTPMGFVCRPEYPPLAVAPPLPEGSSDTTSRLVVRQRSRRRPPKWPCARHVRGKPRNTLTRSSTGTTIGSGPKPGSFTPTRP